MPNSRTTFIQTELKRLSDSCQGSTITLEELFSSMHPKNQILVVFILSLPFLLPIPLPGLSIPFGVLIAWISFRMFLGRSFWLPSFIRSKRVSCDRLRWALERAEPLAQFLSKWVKPRGTLFLRVSGTKRLSLFFIALCGALLALPLPPGTNSPPALTATLLSLGVLEEDSVFVGLGYCCFFLITLLFGTILVWGYPHILQWFGY